MPPNGTPTTHAHTGRACCHCHTAGGHTCLGSDMSASTNAGPQWLIPSHVVRLLLRSLDSPVGLRLPLSITDDVAQL